MVGDSESLTLIRRLSKSELPALERAFKVRSASKKRRKSAAQLDIVNSSVSFTLIGEQVACEGGSQKWNYKVMSHLTRKVRLRFTKEFTHLRSVNGPGIAWNGRSESVLAFFDMYLTFTSLAKSQHISEECQRHCRTDIAYSDILDFSFEGDCFVYVSKSMKSIFVCRLMMKYNRGRQAGITGYTRRRITASFSGSDPSQIMVSSGLSSAARPSVAKTRSFTPRTKRMAAVLDDECCRLFSLSDTPVSLDQPSLVARISIHEECIKINNSNVKIVCFSPSMRRVGLLMEHSEGRVIIFNVYALWSLESSNCFESKAPTKRHSSAVLLRTVEGALFNETRKHSVDFWTDNIVIIAFEKGRDDSLKYHLMFYDLKSQLKLLEMDPLPLFKVPRPVRISSEAGEFRDKFYGKSEDDSWQNHFAVHAQYPGRMALHIGMNEMVLWQGQTVFYDPFTRIVEYWVRMMRLRRFVWDLLPMIHQYV